MGTVTKVRKVASGPKQEALDFENNRFALRYSRGASQRLWAVVASGARLKGFK